MKYAIPSKILATSILFFFMCFGYAQETEKKKMTPEEKKAYADKRADEEYKNIEAAFLDMFRKANLAYKNVSPETCDAFSYVKNLKEDRFITVGFYSETHLILQKMFDLFAKENRKNLIGNYLDENKKNLEIDIDKGGFKTLLDKLLGASSNSKDFADFVSLFTGQDIGDISKNDLSYLKAQYDRSKGLRATPLHSAHQYEDYIEYPREDCGVHLINSIRETKNKYPNSEWLFTSEITYNCGCQEGSDQTTLNKAVYKYTGKVTSLSTAADIVFSTSVSNPKLSISNVVCCPDRKETEKTASAAPAEESKHFIKDTRDIFLNNPETNESSVAEASDAEGSFFREAGSFAYGVHLGKPIGDEADFFGFTYGTEVGYFQSLSDKFQLGATAGYARYTGKETDFGFETEGESFIPLMLLAALDLSKAFGVEAGLGYAISASEGGEGGFTYRAGPFWRPLEAVLIAINYMNISFGEGSLGAVMLRGRVSLSKK